MYFPVLHSTDYSDCIPETPRSSKQFFLYGDDLNATSFIHVNSVPFLSVQYCPFPIMGSCAVTKTLVPHVQINLLRGSRWAGAPYGWCSKSYRRFSRSIRKETCYFSRLHSTNKHVATLSVVQRRLSIYNWNPVSRWGNEDALEH